MKQLKRVAGLSAVALLVIGCVLSIVSTVGRPSPALARPEDEAAANRIETANTGEDFRLDGTPEGMIAARGVIEPSSRPVNVATSSSGVVFKVWVQEGDQVEADQPLVTLKNDVASARVASARAEVASAQTALKRARGGSQRVAVDRSKAELANAKAQTRRAKDRVRRLEAVVDAGAVSDEEVTVAKLELETLAASEDAARLRLDELRSQRLEDDAEAVSRLERARANLDLEQAQLARLTIRAPMAAEVLQLKFRVGEYYAPGGSEPLAVLGDTSVLRARIDVDERDIARVKSGDLAQLRVPSLPDTRFSARVESIGRRMGRKNVRADDPSERNDTRILEVVLTLDDTESLVVGQRVDAFIDGSSTP
ncbi:MAG: efflux RND transporter periplasmic adaptor subunit [Myxococcota bacterium]